MEKIKVIKDSLRIIEAKYVNSKKTDDNSYKIIFTYKNRNYNLDINKQYKFIMITMFESVYGMDINDNTLDLVDYIKQMITFTEYEDYNVFAFSLRKDIIEDKIYNTLQVIKETNDYDTIIDIEEPVKMVDNYETSPIQYNCGLSMFDKRLFNDNIFEDFYLKVSTFCEEDLYLIYITLLSYYYKLISNKWKDEIVDPYIIENMLNVVYEQIQTRYSNYNFWLSEWNKYFSAENIEKYLNNKEKGLCK